MGHKALFWAPTGRKREKNAFQPKPIGTGLRGTKSTLGAEGRGG